MFIFLIIFNIGIDIFWNIEIFLIVLSNVIFCGVVIIIVFVIGICCERVSWILFVFGGILIIK